MSSFPSHLSACITSSSFLLAKKKNNLRIINQIKLTARSLPPPLQPTQDNPPSYRTPFVLTTSPSLPTTRAVASFSATAKALNAASAR